MCMLICVSVQTIKQINPLMNSQTLNYLVTNQDPNPKYLPQLNAHLTSYLLPPTSYLLPPTSYPPQPVSGCSCSADVPCSQSCPSLPLPLITSTCSCPPLPEPPPPASPPAPLKDHHSLPSNTDTRAPSSLPKTTNVPSRKRPRHEESSEGYREQHSHYGYHGQRARDHHQSDEYHRGGSRHYHRGKPYEDRLHW